jgi:hypothetical protein
MPGFGLRAIDVVVWAEFAAWENFSGSGGLPTGEIAALLVATDPFRSRGVSPTERTSVGRRFFGRAVNSGNPAGLFRHRRGFLALGLKTCGPAPASYLK